MRFWHSLQESISVVSGVERICGEAEPGRHKISEA
jgi:hypothetical protein